MGTEAVVWVVALAVAPAAVMTAYGLGSRGKRFYALAAASACLLAILAPAPLAFYFFAPRFRDFSAVLESSLAHPLGPLPFVLVPFAATLWVLTVLVTPAGRLDEASLARTAMVCLLTMGSFLTASPWLLVFFWALTVVMYVAGHGGPHFNGARRVAVVYMGLSTVLLAAGVVAAASGSGRSGQIEQIGVGLILAAALIRQGIFPFHAWIPEIFDRGRIGPASIFSAPQMGTYVALILVVPHCSPALLRAAAVLGLITALYAVFLALYQTDARRTCGYLFVSQSALVVAGLDLPSPEALVGALILWVSSGLALAGLSRCVLVLEARRGRLSLDRFHGGYERMPILAACFLILSLAIMGFPVTLGFVGEEMLVRGAVDSFPGLGLSVVAAGALTGLVVMRMYFSLFCGRRRTGARLRMLRTEGLGFSIAALLLLGFGMAPAKLVRLLDRAGAAVMQSREAVMPDMQKLE
ncbi:MAG: hypothetical protein HYT79_09005 [Elusimicrobia bacterium]|nr:hypothetical protein [Elusimicrobiota bacterium]